MIEESDVKSTSPEKLLIDDPSDFKFHAAYLKYSNAFDKSTNPEIKKQLNESIIALQLNQTDYPTYYEKLSRYEGEGSQQHRYARARIESQRKREWRQKTKKRERDKRHKT